MQTSLSKQLLWLCLLCFNAHYAKAAFGDSGSESLKGNLGNGDYYFGEIGTTSKRKHNVLALGSTVTDVSLKAPRASSNGKRGRLKGRSRNSSKHVQPKGRRKVRSNRHDRRRGLFNIDEADNSIGSYSKGVLYSVYSSSDTSGTTWIDQWTSTSTTPQTVTCTIDWCSFESSGTIQFSLKLGSSFASINDGDDVVSGDTCPLTVSATTDSAQDVYTMMAMTSGSGDVYSTYSCKEAPAPTSAPTSTPPEVEQPDPDDGDMGCFSATSSVQVFQKGQVAMKDLQIGDSVLTSKHQYEPVYSFGHKQEKREAVFLQIYTNEQKPIELTGDHLIYALDKNGNGRMVPAQSISVGDMLLHDSQPVAVIRIKPTRKKGLYMPLTPSGTIVVNGILASTYISLRNEVPDLVDTAKMIPLVSDSTILHWWLSPLRMLCLGVTANMCQPEYLRDTNGGILWWLRAGKVVAEFADSQDLVTRVVLLGPPVFLLFGFLNFCETAFGGASLAPLMVMAIVGGFVWLRRASETKQKA